MKHLSLSGAVAAALLAAVPAMAQKSSGPGPFEMGHMYIGPRIWLGNLNGAVAFGGQIERPFTAPGKSGPGMIAGGLGIDFYTWSNHFGVGNGKFSYTVIPIQIFGNYHFVIESNKKLDPYVGLALVYSHVGASCSGVLAGACNGAEASYTDFAGQGGLRYWFSEKLAAQGQIGFGYGTLGIGLTWKI